MFAWILNAVCSLNKRVRENTASYIVSSSNLCLINAVAWVHRKYNVRAHRAPMVKCPIKYLWVAVREKLSLPRLCNELAIFKEIRVAFCMTCTLHVVSILRLWSVLSGPYFVRVCHLILNITVFVAFKFAPPLCLKLYLRRVYTISTMRAVAGHAESLILQFLTGFLLRWLIMVITQLSTLFEIF